MAYCLYIDTKEIQQNDLFYYSVHKRIIQFSWNANLKWKCLLPLYYGLNIELLPPLHNSDRCWTCWCFEKNHDLTFQIPALLCLLEMEVHLERSKYHNTLCMKMSLFFGNAYVGGNTMKSAIYSQTV